MAAGGTDQALAALSPTDRQTVQAYLAHVAIEKRLSSRTVALYTLDLGKLAALAQAAGLPLAAVQSHQVRRWVAGLHSGGRTGRGIALILSGWRSFYRWLGHQGRVPSNPVQDIRAPRSPKPLPKALGVDDAVQLASHEQPGADPVREARDRCMVELLYGSGLRLGELLGLDVQPGREGGGWVDAAAAEVHVLGKGAKRRSVPVGPHALLALTEWLGQRPPAPHFALFLGARGGRLTPQQARLALKARSATAGLATPVHPHMLRHSFASHVLQSSGDLRAVQELLGHANITTTQVYTRLDFQHLAKAYDAAHPRSGLVTGSPGADGEGSAVKSKGK